MSVIDFELFSKMFKAIIPKMEGIPSLCSPEDVAVLVSLINGFSCNSIVEIGVNVGGTASVLLRECPNIIRYRGVDVLPGYKTPLEVQQREVPDVPGRLVMHDPRFQLILRSHGSLNLNAASAEVRGTADFVFIDGSHDYSTVSHDTELARAMTSCGGVIVWHDFDNPGVKAEGVDRLINHLNSTEGDHIVHPLGTSTVFEVRQAGE